MNPFESLKKDFPVFKVYNKTRVAQHIKLANGEDVQIQEGAYGKINSSDLIQLPDLSAFKMITPSTSDLILYDVIVKPSKPAPEKKSEKTEIELK